MTRPSETLPEYAVTHERNPVETAASGIAYASDLWARPMKSALSGDERRTALHRHAIPRQLIILLAASLAFLILWSVCVPVFEAPDEPAHWAYARYIHVHLSLPRVTQSSYEATDPPLYYLLVAPLAFSTALPVERENPGVGSKAWYIHTGNELRKYWPIRLARFEAIMLSVVTVLFAYLSGLEATRRRHTGLLVGGLIAFLPQFTFRGMNVSPDALLVPLSAVFTYLLIRGLKRGFSSRLCIVTALVMSGAILTKPSAIFLPATFVIALLACRMTWRERFIRLSAVGLVGLAVLPWFIHNISLYGDPLASNAAAIANAGLVHHKSLTDPYFVVHFPPYLIASFFAGFGWMDVWPPKWTYGLFIVLGLAAAYGHMRKDETMPRRGRLLVVLTSIPVLNLLIVIYYNLTYSQAQGRFMYISLVALTVLLVLGLERIPSLRSRPYLTARSAIVAMAVLNVYVLIQVVVRAYGGVA
jgi:4-amino-4-deoxy-L-arabinose transferase-like glycosyltransferase